jgi:hypothetical protein
MKPKWTSSGRILTEHGHIVATCKDVATAERLVELLNHADPFSVLHPENHFDPARVGTVRGG